MSMTVTKGSAGGVIRIILVAFLMLTLAVAGIELTRLSAHIAAVWLANGAVLAVMLRAPRREWIMLALAATSANVVANLIGGNTVWMSVALSACNMLEIGLMLAFLGKDYGQRPFDNFKTIFNFAFLAGTIPAISGALAAVILLPSFDWATLRLFTQWYLADALGLLMVTPLALAWSQRWTMPGSWRSTAKAGGLLVAILAVSALIFSDPEPRLFLLCPLLLLAGFRLQIPAAAAVAALSAIVAIGFTLAGMGPIAAAASATESHILLLQAFFAVSLILTIPVSAINGERGRLQLALAASERQFRLLAEASPAGILQCELDGTPCYVNAVWTRLTGTTLDDVRSKGWEVVVAPSERAHATRLWHQARGRIAEVNDTLSCPIAGRPAGKAEIFVTPERDVGGTLVGWVVRLTDVTDRVQAVQALKESELQYRLLADNTRDIITRIALDGTALFVSAAARQLLGGTPEQLVGQPIRSSIHCDDWPVVQRSLESLAGGMSEQGARYRQRCADGSFIWVEAVYHLVRDPSSNLPIEIVASVRDIDRRQRADLIEAEVARKLRENVRLLTMAENMAGVGHWHFDRSEGVMEISPTAAAIAGMTMDRVIVPGDAMQLVVASDRRLVLRALAAANAGRPSSTCQIRITRPDGSERTLDVAFQSEKEKISGPVSGIFGVIHDITHKVVAEQKLIDALAKSREAADAKSKFLATMSHEIRTPMTGVLGMIDLLMADPSEEERQSFLGTLKQSATLLMTVLDDVLDFSKLEHGGIEIRPCDFDFEALAQSTLDLFFNAASHKGLLISLALDPGTSPYVHGDPVRIQQVMSNLINNAIKFTDSGSVTIKVKARPAAGSRQMWRIEVRDTGIGIEPNQAALLFDPFTQAEQGTGRRFGGTGLGLAISRQLVETMGGTLAFDSKPGEGSTFWFELPLDAAQSVPARPRPVRDVVKPARALRVLVAEDNPVNQLLITALLRRQGHQAHCVDDGLKAVETASREAFDCILMDMQMPVMDGITATRTIRQSDGPCAQIPIIALTADATPERRRFYDNAGLTNFMTKPIDGPALGALLAAIAAPEAAVEAGDPAIDDNHLERLRAALGPKRLDSLLALFVDELDSRPREISDHLLAGRLDDAKRDAHSLKGAALSVGAVALGNAALAIEQLTSAIDIKANARLIGDLEQAVAAVRAELGNVGKRARVSSSTSA